MKNNINILENFDKYFLEYKQLVFFGSAHVSKKSRKILEYAFKKYDFKAVALELDFSRFVALLNDEKPKFSNVFKMYNGFFWYFLSKIQRSVAKKFQTSVGEEMKIASELATIRDIPIYLIDLPIEITMKKMRKVINFKFFLKLILSAFKKEKVNVKVNDFVDLEYNEVNKLLEVFKKEFPEAYDVLIEQRNRYMAKNLIDLMERYSENEKVLVIVGKGHIPGLLNILQNYLINKD
ncbi:MAG: TraB/GumN family protein [Candidatus Woesearchaeota archaeon]